MIKNVLNNKKNDNSKLQIETIFFLEKLFIYNEIYDFKEDSYFFIGVRGKYDGINNYSINFKFNYFKHKFNFYLCYDQLEYYITKEGKTIKECNLEDFWDTEKHIEKFINYLKKDLKKLNIPFNE